MFSTQFVPLQLVKFTDNEDRLPIWLSIHLLQLLFMLVAHSNGAVVNLQLSNMLWYELSAAVKAGSSAGAAESS